MALKIIIDVSHLFHETSPLFPNQGSDMFSRKGANEDFQRFNFHCSHQIFINFRYIYSSGHVADLVGFLT